MEKLQCQKCHTVWHPTAISNHMCIACWRNWAIELSLSADRVCRYLLLPPESDPDRKSLTLFDSVKELDTFHMPPLGLRNLTNEEIATRFKSTGPYETARKLKRKRQEEAEAELQLRPEVDPAETPDANTPSND